MAEPARCRSRDSVRERLKPAGCSPDPRVREIVLQNPSRYPEAGARRLRPWLRAPGRLPRAAPGRRRASGCASPATARCGGSTATTGARTRRPTCCRSRAGRRRTGGEPSPGRHPDLRAHRAPPGGRRPAIRSSGSCACSCCTASCTAWATTTRPTRARWSAWSGGCGGPGSGDQSMPETMAETTLPSRLVYAWSFALLLPTAVILAVLSALLERSGPIRLRHWAEEAGGRLRGALRRRGTASCVFRFILSLAARLAPVGLFRGPRRGAGAASGAARPGAWSLGRGPRRRGCHRGGEPRRWWGTIPSAALRRADPRLPGRPAPPLAARWRCWRRSSPTSRWRATAREDEHAKSEVGHGRGDRGLHRRRHARGHPGAGAGGDGCGASWTSATRVVRSVMTPRIDMVCAPVDCDHRRAGRALHRVRPLAHPALPGLDRQHRGHPAHPRRAARLAPARAAAGAGADQAAALHPRDQAARRAAEGAPGALPAGGDRGGRVRRHRRPGDGGGPDRGDRRRDHGRARGARRRAGAAGERRLPPGRPAPTSSSWTSCSRSTSRTRSTRRWRA